MFSKILIANRGEIACRVIKTARRMGIQTVAVYSDADVAAQHVLQADQAVHIGPAPARESYLNIDRIIKAAVDTGAEAIHPGYGFLSENEEFAAACEKAGIVFVGPPASAIAAMGLKSAAKALMEAAHVPLVPGYHGENQDADYLKTQAAKIGYPVLIKASAGGGGKGMRRVDRQEDFIAALESAQREAASSFGDASMLIEKYILQPRHIEIQVFGDRHGNAVYLFERDCSIQRRHQKVVEEAPAPNWPADKRKAMGKAAVAAARAINYVGAGTVEFIVDQSGAFYFMEMNTRLQVEHPVTEMITGQDLVEWQLRVAAGEKLPKTQAALDKPHGHAIEVRIYAEDPDHDFRPAAGRIDRLSEPPLADWLRIDTGFVEGDMISVYYDPMIAKLIVWGDDRATAINRLRDALRNYRVGGLTTNLAFLRRLVALPDFLEAKLDTGLIDRHRDDLLSAHAKPSPRKIAALCLAMLAHRANPPSDVEGKPKSPWHDREGWQLNLPRHEIWHFRCDGSEIDVTLDMSGSDVVIDIDGAIISGRYLAHSQMIEIDGYRERAVLYFDRNQVTFASLEGDVILEWRDRTLSGLEDQAGAGHLVAPMPGKVIAVNVRKGQKVTRGDILVIVEAMKMEHAILASGDGVVTDIMCEPGSLVDGGALLIDMKSETA